MRKAVLAAIAAIAFATGAAWADDGLRFEGRVALGQVAGRLDHMAIDLRRQRLFLAELGNNTVSVIDLAARKLFKRIAGLHEPQGIAYDPFADHLYIANGGDGTVAVLAGADLSRIGTVALGEDADNIRVEGADRVLVGYGNGAIALLAGGKKIADFRLESHPESFQADEAVHRLFVNEPEAQAIAVLDTLTGRQLARWNVSGLRGNFPMALDRAGHRVFVAYRSPPTLAVFETVEGKLLDRAPTCGDADDISFDDKRNRLYVSCGEGFLAVIGTDRGKLSEISRISTAPGARTGLFVPQLDRFYLAVRASTRGPAEIRVYAPQ